MERIREFADRAHGGQLRRYTPERYIVHPVRVMERCAEQGATRAQQAAALLHDVLEDTRVDEEELLRFLRSVMEAGEAQHTLALVVELTDVYTTAAYPKWKRRRRKEAETERMATISAEAQTAKYADILDNAREIVRHDPNFAPKFLKECRQALRVMKEGDAGLRAEALQVVQGGLDALPRRRNESS
ncbi:HD domain-containing protein [Flaviaesturariibacter amylovorans]|uniref:HD domain-containing protein n=1 Tax=Flaviaesturariibacter amylovorans TaxID=1084520 RepID=UPI0031F19261